MAPQPEKAVDVRTAQTKHGLWCDECKVRFEARFLSCLQERSNWPCSRYPNYALGQVSDRINDIYPRWAACHGALIVTPVHWYQLARPLDQALDWDTPVQQVVGNVAAAIAAIAAAPVCCAPASWHGPIVI